MTTNIKKYSGKVIQQAYEILSNCELLAIPSETVYGLGADATSDSAISKIYKLKKRPHINPLILHVSSIQMVEQFEHFLDPIYEIRIILIIYNS